MTKTTKPRVPRNLKPETTIAAEAAAVEQKTAREANSAALNNQVRDIIAEYVNAEKATATAKRAWEDAGAAQMDKLESVYVALAKLAHENDMTPDMCTAALNAALTHFYGAEQLKSGVSAAGKLRSQLTRAMHKEVRANLPAIIAPWKAAWADETKAKAAKKDAETPMRKKFHSQGVAVTQALQLAADDKASVKLARPADVLTWVKEHPRKARGATTPNGTTPATAAAKAATAAGEGMSDMDKASAKVDALIAAVKAVSSEYGDPDCFVAVLDALAKCTAKVMVRKPASEPVAGVSDVDDAITLNAEEYAQFKALLANKGK